MRVLVLMFGACSAANWGAPPNASRASARLDDSWRCVFHKKSVGFPDPDAEHEGHRVIRIESADDSEVLCDWAIDAAPFRGHRIRISMTTKMNGYAPFAHLWADTSTLSEWSVIRIACAAGSDWTTTSVVLDVPVDATQLDYGVTTNRILLEEWPKLEIVSDRVPLTEPNGGGPSCADH